MSQTLYRDAPMTETPARPLPSPDRLSAEFWRPHDDGRLRIQRCSGCATWHHPPVAVCSACLSADLGFEPVSGEGRVYSYSLTVSGARHPAFAAQTPYLVGLVELIEQPHLLLYTNFPGAELRDMACGKTVTVEFERVDDDIAIPQFRLAPGEVDAACR